MENEKLMLAQEAFTQMYQIAKEYRRLAQEQENEIGLLKDKIEDLDKTIGQLKREKRGLERINDSVEALRKDSVDEKEEWVKEWNKQIGEIKRHITEQTEDVVISIKKDIEKQDRDLKEGNEQIKSFFRQQLEGVESMGTKLSWGMKDCCKRLEILTKGADCEESSHSPWETKKTISEKQEEPENPEEKVEIKENTDKDEKFALPQHDEKPRAKRNTVGGTEDGKNTDRD